MPKLEDPAGPTGGGAMRPDAELQTAVEQPRPDRLAEADRRRRIADRIVVQGLFAPRGH